MGNNYETRVEEFHEEQEAIRRIKEKLDSMTDDQLRHIFVEIADGRGNHGSFVRSFAVAYMWADEGNKMILREAAKTLVNKYSLDKYLDNYGMT